MTAVPSIDPAQFLTEHLSQASPDLMRDLLTTFVNALLGAQADAVCGAGYGERTPERVNSRNGYRHRDLDTRVGTVDVAVPKLRSGSFFPDWLLERRSRAERALTTVIATCYLKGVSTRFDERPGRQPGDHQPVEIPGVRDGQGPRLHGRGLPPPPTRRRTIPVRILRRADNESP